MSRSEMSRSDSSTRPIAWLEVEDRKTQLRVLSAADFWSRLRGLLGRAQLQEDEGLWIRPCNSVHTFGMTYAIDVLFLDKEQRVVRIAHRLQSMRIAGARKAQSTLELVGGVASKLGIAEGMQLRMQSRRSGE